MHGIRFYHAHHVYNEIVQIHQLPSRPTFLNHALNAANHIASAASVRHNVTEQFAELAEINIAAINKALPGAGVTDDSGKRLIQFVGNGCRQFTYRGHTAEMADFFVILSRFRFGHLTRRYVYGNTNEPRGLAVFPGYTASLRAPPAASSIR